jgi:hypothetical protein
MPRAVGIKITIPIPSPASLQYGNAVNATVTCHVDDYGAVSDLRIYKTENGTLTRAREFEEAIRSDKETYDACLDTLAVLIMAGEGELTEKHGRDTAAIPDPEPAGELASAEG